MHGVFFLVGNIISICVFVSSYVIQSAIAIQLNLILKDQKLHYLWFCGLCSYMLCIRKNFVLGSICHIYGEKDLHGLIWVRNELIWEKTSPGAYSLNSMMNWSSDRPICLIRFSTLLSEQRNCVTYLHTRLSLSSSTPQFLNFSLF